MSSYSVRKLPTASRKLFRYLPALRNPTNKIRRALAQSVSDHLDEKKKTTTKSATTCLFLFQVSSTNEQFSRNGIRKKPFQEKGSEMDSEMSSCSCFLLRQLFLVQKTAHARGAVREPRAMVIVPCLSQGGSPFFEQFFETLFSLQITILDEKCLQNGPQMWSFGT